MSATAEGQPAVNAEPGTVAADRIAALIVMNHGTHLAFYAHPDAADVQEEARVFLAANS
jgi:hypothetical protein